MKQYNMKVIRFPLGLLLVGIIYVVWIFGFILLFFEQFLKPFVLPGCAQIYRENVPVPSEDKFSVLIRVRDGTQKNADVLRIFVFLDKVGVDSARIVVAAFSAWS
jgi:hypothetical protein